MRVYDSIALMFKEMRHAKIIVLVEWRHIKNALGWRYDHYMDQYKKVSAKKKVLKERKEHNDKVLRPYGLGPNNRR